MIKRWDLIFTWFVVFLIFFSGCISEKKGENRTNPGNIQSPSPTNLLVNATMKTPERTTSTIETSPIQQTSWFMRLAQNETAYNRYPDNISYNLSINDVTFRKGASSGNVSSYITKITITAKNGGLRPINLMVRGVGFTDDSGDGCVYKAPYWCDIIDFSRINPGESQTKTANITFQSNKDLMFFLSKKFEYEVEIGEEDSVSHGGWDGNRNSWIIDKMNSS